MIDIGYIRRKLKLAKRRLVYWSGRPSFCGFGYSPGSHPDPDGQYENAWADCQSWADLIEKATGKRPVVRDVKEEFREAFCRIAFRQPEARP